jgi:hypothetical protein
MKPSVLALVLLAALDVGCGQAGSPPPATPLAQAGRPSLRLTLSSDRQSYAAGQPVTLTLTVENTGAAPVVVTSPSAQLYELAVRQGDREIWRSGAGGGFATEITEWTLGPGDRREFAETWRPPPGTAPGDYAAIATLMGGAALGVLPMKLPIAIR